MPVTDFLQARLDTLRATGQFRELPPHRQGTDFWSNDYLGFSRLLHAAPPTGIHAPGSRLISGNHPRTEALEARIARFHGYPAALLYGSGYAANTGLLGCLGRRTDTIVYDAYIHASLRDGIRLSGATARRCKHNRVEDFGMAISSARPDGQVFVVTEGRFSMDGDVAPLSELAVLCGELGAHLIVDEAHTTGLDGPLGAGTVAAAGIQDRVFATVQTYGKAAGFHGAAVLGSRALRDYLVNFSRPFIYTTAVPPAYVAGLEAVYDALAARQPEAVDRLRSVIARYRERIGDRLPGTDRGHDGPIQTVRLPGNERVMRAEARLLAAGYLVKGIRSPTVAPGSERLRICLHAFNTFAEVDGLVDQLAAVSNHPV